MPGMPVLRNDGFGTSANPIATLTGFGSLFWTFIDYDAQFSDMPQQQWLLAIAGLRPVGCELSDIGSHLAAARASAGVAGLPCFLGDEEPGLMRLEHEGAMFSRDIWLVVHRDLRRSVPVRAVMDFVAKVVVEKSGLGLTLDRAAP